MSLRKSISRFGLIFSVALVAALADAVETNVWPFSNPANYNVSDPTLIEVGTNGTARLLLQANTLLHDTVAEYTTNGVTIQNLDVGRNASVTLAESGGLFVPSGSFRSRVLDGGLGNTWQSLRTRVSNRLMPNSANELAPVTSNLVAYYRNNNDSWQNYVTGGNGTPIGGVLFTTDARFGTHAGSFNGTSARVRLEDSSLLQGQTAFSISCWLKLRSWTDLAGIILSRGSGTFFGLHQRAAVEETMQFTVSASGGTAAPRIGLDLDRWYFVTAVWDGASGDATIYLDAQPVDSRNGATGTAMQNDFFYMAWDDFSTGSRRSDCILDEVAIWDRRLTPDEIRDLYERAAPVKLQIRSGSSTNLTGSFVGPDGTPTTFFAAESGRLQTTNSFDAAERYIQYEVTITSDASGTRTPWLEAVAISGSRAHVTDNVVTDFEDGAFTSTAIKPDAPIGGYIGLSGNAQGGFYTNGIFISDTYDAGGPASTWDQITWDEPAELDASLPGLEALYHANGDWSDASGNDHTGVPANMADDNFGKFGGTAGRFNGVNASVTVPRSIEVNSVEFWVKPDGGSGGLVSIDTAGGTAHISLSNHHVYAEAFNGGSEVYVNGKSRSTRLLEGWNHVGVTFDVSMSATNIVFGQVGSNQYFRGSLDEVALNSTPLESGDYTERFDLGRRQVGGSARFQVRAGNVLPLSGAFVGPGGNPSVYYIDNTGLPSLPASFNGMRYFQYRVVMDSDGVVTPYVANVEVTYALGSTVYTNTTGDDFAAGEYVDSRTRWYGEKMLLPDVYSPSPPNLDASVDGTFQGLWHLDEAVWGAGATVIDSATGKNGTSGGGAQPGTVSAIGSGAGVFDGIDDFVSIPALNFNGTAVSFGMWFRTDDTSRSALISSYSGGGAYVALEINSDGASQDAGRMALVVNDGGGDVVVTSTIHDLNDDVWHHVFAVRDGDALYLYVDGDLVGSTYSAGLGPLGNAALRLAQHGSQSIYYRGLLDEVTAYSRALPQGEIAHNAGIGHDEKSTGFYESPPLDAGRPAIWSELSWGSDAPYGMETPGSADGLAALWHFDEASGNAIDASPNSNHGTVSGASYSQGGRFNDAFGFAGGGQYVEAVHSLSLVPGQVSVTAWILPSEISDRMIVDKHNGTGYELGLDVDGKPYFRVNGSVVTGLYAIRLNEWSHITGVYTGSRLLVYVNGQLSADAPAGAIGSSGGPLRIGYSLANSMSFDGRIDEVAVYDRPLITEEILDRYKAGVGRLELQVRSDSVTPLTTTYGGPAGAGTYIQNQFGQDLKPFVPQNQYFQYRLYTETEDPRYPPEIQFVQADESGYPTTHPWVETVVGVRQAFSGELVGFLETLGLNQGSSSIEYQISGDTTNWYYWGGSNWVVESGLGWALETSPANEVNSNIGSLFDELYPKTGGQFGFRAFLHSDGDDQIELDEVELHYSAGRILVDFPNGTETNEQSLLTDTPYFVQWSSAGVVSDNLAVEYSLNGLSGPWITIASGVSNTGSQLWITPWVTGDDNDNEYNVRVRVRDLDDPTISDTSDGDFHILWGFQVKYPNGGETLYAGETTNIVWDSSIGLGALKIDFSSDSGGTFLTPEIVYNLANTPSSTNNTYAWTIPLTDPRYISETARIRIETLGFRGTDTSDNDFILAGNIPTSPTGGSSLKRNSPFSVQWLSAGSGPLVHIDFSPDGGTNWQSVASNVVNVTGSNSYIWAVDVLPTEQGVLRITSVSAPRATGQSEQFTVADIAMVSPDGGETWLSGSTQDVIWISAGASATVNLQYSLDGGSTFTNITTGIANNPGSNTYSWIVPPVASGQARVRVQDGGDPTNLFAISASDFNIAGLSITFPNGGEIWDMGTGDTIRWDQQSVGNDADISFSYDGGVTYSNLSGPSGVGLSDLFYFYTPVYPTVRGVARIDARDPSPYTNIFDESDAFFTVAGILSVAPSNGTVWTLGTTQGIQWVSAGAVDPLNQARIWLSQNGAPGTFTNLITSVGNNQAYPGGNTYNWAIDRNLSPSTIARIMVESGGYSATSDVFTLRGLRVSIPGPGAINRLGSPMVIAWEEEGLTPGQAVGDIYVSTDGGTTYSPTPINGVISQPFDADGAFPWTVDPSLEPTTNAVFMLVVTAPAADTDIVAFSRPSTFQGIKVLTPASGASLTVGTTNTISFLAAGAGTSVDISYAEDGVNFDTVNLIADDLPIVTGSNSFQWVIETIRRPTTNARIRVEGSIDSGVSEIFTLNGIFVDRPRSSDIWALDETNRISWTAVGFPGPYNVEYLINGGGATLIQGGVVTNFFDWVIPSNAIASNVSIRVTDIGSSFNGLSDEFLIVGEPTISITFPQAGDYLKVGTTNTIIWNRGGKMTNDFLVRYSTFPYVITNTIFNGAATFDITQNTFAVDWFVPDNLGRTRLIIDSNDDPQITDTRDDFFVVGNFRVIYPNGGETNVFALKPTTVSWTTKGSVNLVDLYESIDGGSSWTKVNATPIANNPGTAVSEVLTTYSWTVPDPGGPVPGGRFRVQEAAYTNIYPLNTIGPFDDSDADFPISYYEIVWNVFDAATTNALDFLSVSDSSGWSAFGLQAPVTNFYPYGLFDTMWSREFFEDNVTFQWLSEPSRTIDVPMIQTGDQQDFEVLSDFLYISGTNILLPGTFKIAAWMQRSGQIIENPTSVSIEITDETGAVVDTINSSSATGAGVFFLTWNVPVVYPTDTLLFAKTTIVLSGVPYTAGIVYRLRVPGDADAQDILDRIALAENQITSRVETVRADVAVVSTNLIAHEAAQAAFRAQALGRLDTIVTNTTDILSELDGVTNTLDRIDTNVVSVLTGVTNIQSFVTNLPGPSVWNSLTNLATQFTNVVTAVENLQGRFLNRPTELVLGETIRIWYTTATTITGTPVITVYNSANTAVQSVSMTSHGSGTYYANLTASWGLGEYSIEAVDSRGRDRITVMVRAASIDSLALAIGMISNQVATLETNLAAVSTNVVAIRLQTDTIMWNDVTTIQGIVSNMQAVTDTIDWQDVSDILTAASNIESRVETINTQVETINWGDIAQIQNQLGELEFEEYNFSALDDISLIMNSMSDLGLRLGNAQDPAASDTFFGRLNQLIETLNTVGDDTLDSSRNARQAKTQAMTAQTMISQLRDAVEDGDKDQIQAMLSKLQGTMSDVAGGIGSIQEKSLGHLEDEILETRKDVRDMLAMVLADQAEEDALDGEDKPKASIDDVNKQIAEMKANIELMQKVLDRVANPTVVTVDWFE